MCRHHKHGMYITLRQDWVLASQDCYCCQIQDTLFCNLLVQIDYFNWVKFSRPFWVSLEYNGPFPSKFLKDKYIQRWLFTKLHRGQIWLFILTSFVTQGCHHPVSLILDTGPILLSQLPAWFLFVCCVLMSYSFPHISLYFQSVSSRLF